jgi:hypothetical protein
VAGYLGRHGSEAQGSKEKESINYAAVSMVRVHGLSTVLPSDCNFFDLQGGKSHALHPGLVTIGYF